MDSSINVISPPNLGWLEKKLNKNEIQHLWRIVDQQQHSFKHNLAGNIYQSNSLIDENEWFLNNTLLPLCEKYAEVFSNIGDKIPTAGRHPYYLNSIWVNYQKQNEFNPLHKHDGIYSFVVWLKIPTRHNEQNEISIAKTSNYPTISSFYFIYTNILGDISDFIYEMNPEVEGTLLFFPSNLCHGVYPFFNCNEDRISISGNIGLNTKIML